MSRLEYLGPRHCSASFVHYIIHNLQDQLSGKLKHRYGYWLRFGTTFGAQTLQSLHIRQVSAQLANTSSNFFHAFLLHTSFTSRLVVLKYFNSTLSSFSKLFNPSILSFFFTDYTSCLHFLTKLYSSKRLPCFLCQCLTFNKTFFFFCVLCFL